MPVWPQNNDPTELTLREIRLEGPKTDPTCPNCFSTNTRPLDLGLFHMPFEKNWTCDTCNNDFRHYPLK